MFDWIWSWWSPKRKSSRTPQILNSQTRSRIVPEKSINHDHDGEESLDAWGFQDTRFQAYNDSVVEVTGSRYPLSGQKLPSLLPWFNKLMEVEISGASKFESSYPPPTPVSTIDDEFISEIRETFDRTQISLDAIQRLRHGHGHTQGEMFAIKHASLNRVPDVIIYPQDEKQVINLVQAASKHGICLIPFGGGTNVSEALECPHNETRMIVSIDMGRMNKIKWIDPIDRMACIEAGAVGRHIMEDLAKEGFTMGHEPDSVEFSTLGGWVATNASGMKKNKYGNIEDLVLDVNVVTTSGTLTRSEALPRESVGIDLRKLIFGSEGNLGIITSAIVKIFPLPEVQRYGSVLFPSFDNGVAFMYDLTRAGGQPASIRLVDNPQFQFGIVLKPASTGFAALLSKLQKLYVTKVKGFDPDKMVACTLVFEGTAQEVKRQEETVYHIAAKHKGMKAGAENGKRGYLLTYNIAYIRDFALDHYVLAESFETSIPWSRVLELCDRVRKRVHDEHAIRKLPGKPFVSCRVTQVYETGVAVYFYFAYYFKGVEDPSRVYGEMEKAARDEILLCGGALSHHHGVGNLRKEFMPRIMSEGALEWQRSIKNAVDPQNIFGAGNMATYWNE
jgi:alkyldihydroxyacetonephosphate synthase